MASVYHLLLLFQCSGEGGELWISEYYVQWRVVKFGPSICQFHTVHPLLATFPSLKPRTLEGIIVIWVQYFVRCLLSDRPMQCDGKNRQTAFHKDALCCTFSERAGLVTASTTLSSLLEGMGMLAVVSYCLLCLFSIQPPDAACGSTTWKLPGPQWSPCRVHMPEFLSTGDCVYHWAESQ
jgi:hypothetical protein